MCPTFPSFEKLYMRVQKIVLQLGYMPSMYLNWVRSPQLSEHHRMYVAWRPLALLGVVLENLQTTGVILVVPDSTLSLGPTYHWQLSLEMAPQSTSGGGPQNLLEFIYDLVFLAF